MRSVTSKLVVCLAIAWCGGSLSASAALPYLQPFDTPTSSLAQTEAVYGVTGQSLSNAVVDSGRLQLSPAGQGSLDFGAFPGDLQITFDTSIDGLVGFVNVGLRVGDNNYVFHPGFSGGAFRIDGPGGHSNVGMGFTPSLAALTKVSVTINAATGATAIRITDGSDPSNVYTESFLDSNYASDVTVIGLTVGGSPYGVFDNLAISAAPIPEPRIWVTLSAGLLLVAALARRRLRSRA